MQGLLPAGWLAFTGRESNPLDRYERFQFVERSSSFPALLTLPIFIGRGAPIRDTLLAPNPAVFATRGIRLHRRCRRVGQLYGTNRARIVSIRGKRTRRARGRSDANDPDRKNAFAARIAGAMLEMGLIPPQSPKYSSLPSSPNSGTAERPLTRRLGAMPNSERPSAERDL
jgi:hypothetical protein